MALVRFAGMYEFCANTHGGWSVYLNQPEMCEIGGVDDGSRYLGSWDTIKEAHAAVGAPKFDENNYHYGLCDASTNPRLV